MPVPAEATPQPGQRFLTPPSAPSPLGRLVDDDDDVDDNDDNVMVLFLDALASLKTMLDIQSLIHVFKISKTKTKT